MLTFIPTKSRVLCNRCCLDAVGSSETLGQRSVTFALSWGTIVGRGLRAETLEANCLGFKLGSCTYQRHDFGPVT